MKCKTLTINEFRCHLSDNVLDMKDTEDIRNSDSYFPISRTNRSLRDDIDWWRDMES